MGLEGKGISTYYSPGITEAEIKIVQDFLQSQNLGDQAYNTRLFKDGDVYKLAIASAEVRPRSPAARAAAGGGGRRRVAAARPISTGGGTRRVQLVREGGGGGGVSAAGALLAAGAPRLTRLAAAGQTKAPVTHDFNGSKIEVVYGDHAPFMKVLADSIAEAIKNAPADRADQVAMLQQYVTAFKGGDINAHKDSQRAWVKDKVRPCPASSRRARVCVFVRGLVAVVKCVLRSSQ
jgi:hypothetical protein